VGYHQDLAAQLVIRYAAWRRGEPGGNLSPLGKAVSWCPACPVGEDLVVDGPCFCVVAAVEVADVEFAEVTVHRHCDAQRGGR
jgi:hypothetical protein